MVNIVCYRLPVTAAQLSYCAKAAVDSTEMSGFVCVPIKLYSQKQAEGLIEGIQPWGVVLCMWRSGYSPTPTLRGRGRQGPCGPGGSSRTTSHIALGRTWSVAILPARQAGQGGLWLGLCSYRRRHRDKLGQVAAPPLPPAVPPSCQSTGHQASMPPASSPSHLQHGRALCPATLCSAWPTPATPRSSATLSADA